MNNLVKFIGKAGGNIVNCFGQNKQKPFKDSNDGGPKVDVWRGRAREMVQ